MEPPLDRESATDIAMLAEPVQSWLPTMIGSGRPIEERLTWFWSDHFATAIQKVRIPYLMWRQHLTIRSHATGPFRDLLPLPSIPPCSSISTGPVTTPTIGASHTRPANTPAAK